MSTVEKPTDGWRHRDIVILYGGPGTKAIVMRREDKDEWVDFDGELASRDSLINVWIEQGDASHIHAPRPPSSHEVVQARERVRAWVEFDRSNRPTRDEDAPLGISYTHRPISRNDLATLVAAVEETP